MIFVTVEAQVRVRTTIPVDTTDHADASEKAIQRAIDNNELPWKVADDQRILPTVVAHQVSE